MQVKNPSSIQFNLPKYGNAKLYVFRAWKLWGYNTFSLFINNIKQSDIRVGECVGFELKPGEYEIDLLADSGDRYHLKAREGERYFLEGREIPHLTKTGALIYRDYHGEYFNYEKECAFSELRDELP